MRNSFGTENACERHNKVDCARCTLEHAGLELVAIGDVLAAIGDILGGNAVVVDITPLVERKHAELYPRGCPNRCEACIRRVTSLRQAFGEDSRCERCGSLKPIGQSCGCFDNGSE